MQPLVNTRSYWIQKGLLVTLVCSLVAFPGYSQNSRNIEEKMDNFYMGLLEVYKIIRNDDEEAAIKKINQLEPALIANAKAYAEAAKEAEEMHLDFDEQAFEERLKSKPYYQEMLGLQADEEFMKKYQSSPELQQRMQEIGNLMNVYLGSEESDEEMYEEEYNVLENNEAVFTLEFEDNKFYEGSYTVMSNFDEGAVAYSADEEFSQVEIRGEVNGGEAGITFIVENTGPGKQVWETDGHFTLEFMNEQGELYISLWGSEEMGYIEIDHFGNQNGYIIGTIAGEAMAGDGDDFAPFRATFKVRRMHVD